MQAVSLSLPSLLTHLTVYTDIPPSWAASVISAGSQGLRHPVTGLGPPQTLNSSEHQAGSVTGAWSPKPDTVPSHPSAPASVHTISSCLCTITQDLLPHCVSSAPLHPNGRGYAFHRTLKEMFSKVQDSHCIFAVELATLHLFFN